MKRLLLLGILLQGCISLLWADGVNGLSLAEGTNVLREHFNAELYRSIQMCDIEYVREALANGADVNDVSRYSGETPLLRAIDREDMDIISMLIGKGADVNYANSYGGETPLLRAVSLQNIGIIEMLIKHGVDVDYPNKLGRTPLMRAFFSTESIDAMVMLIKAGADIRPFAESISDPLYSYDLMIVCVKLAGLVRAGEFEVLNKLIEHGVFKKILNTDVGLSYFSNYFCESCLQESDSLENIDLSLIHAEPLIVAQNYCDTLIRLKDGSILKVRGVSAKDVYAYLQERLSISEESAKPYATLNVYLNPGHAFFEVKGEGFRKLLGFYPNEEAGSILEDDYRTESAVLASISAVTFSAVYSMINLYLEFSSYRHNRYLSLALPAAVSTAASAALYRASLNGLPAIDHKLGSVQGEGDARAESIKKDHAMDSFVLNKAQTEKVLDYIKTVQDGCEAHDYDHCTYHFITRNCLTLTQEVFHAAGFEGSPFDFFAEEQLNYTASSFESFYDTKALFYVAWLKMFNF